ncbi:tetratricopeptide repeat protein [Stieleria sp. TO1_6]|uniref:tetratricopeptide repeat protein n=1 Tax=Stieleria tagensis TaxID=2956795 RepID=UPI00209AC7BF|nr:tetratricopeptide repeat protein [Stieleria tagensis]MCO8120613.1 tetratricopeptide repeat protein [Stieleria tagensis]
MRRLNRRVLIIGLVLIVALCLGIAAIHHYQVSRQTDFLVRQAHLARDEGSPAGSIRFLKQALQIEPDRLDILNELAVTQESLGQIEPAFLTSLRIDRLDSADRENQMRLARLAIPIRRYEDAIQRISKLQKESSDQSAVLYSLQGDAYTGILDYDAAEQSYSKAIETGDADIATFAKLAGLLADRLNKPNEAVAVVDDLIRQNPDNARAYIARGSYYIGQTKGRLLSATDDQKNNLGEYLQRAQSDAERAIELSEQSAEALRFASLVAGRREDYQGAITIAESGIQRYPLEADFYRYASAAADSLAKNSEDPTKQQSYQKQALDYLDSGLARMPKSGPLYWQKINSLLDRQDAEGAKEQLTKLKQIGFSQPLLKFAEARQLALSGERLKAVQRLEEVRSEVIEQAELVRLVDLELASTYGALGEHEAQIAALQRIISNDPTWLPGRERLASALLQVGRIDEAVQQYRSIAARPGVPIAAPLNFARLLLLQNLGRDEPRRDWRQVEQILQTLTERQGENSDVMAEVAILRAEMLLAQGKADAADAALAEANGTDAVWSARVLLAISRRQWDSAKQLVEQAVAEIGRTPRVRYAEAALVLTQGAIDNDVQDQLTALCTFPPDWTTQQRLELCHVMVPLLISSQHYELAGQLVDFQISQQPSDLSAQYQRMEIAYRSKDVDTLRETLDQILARAGKTARWNYGQALLIELQAGDELLTDQQNDAAQTFLAEAAVLRPAMAAIPALSGHLNDRQNDVERAIVKYKEAVDLGMRTPTLVRRLVSLLTSNQRFSEADQVIRQSRSGNQPFSSDMARIASEVSAQMSEMQRAERLAAQAANDSGKTGDWVWLARLSELNGNMQQAEDAYQRALQDDQIDDSVRLAWIGFLNRNARLGEAKQALDGFEKTLDPTTDQAGLIAVAQGYLELEETNDAARVLKKIDQQRLVSVKQFEQLFALIKTLRPAAESTEFLRSLSTDSDDQKKEVAVWAKRQLALQLAETGQQENFSIATGLIQQNLKLDPESLEDKRALAIVNAYFLGESNPERPLAMFQALQKSGWTPTLSDQFLIGRLLIANGQWTLGTRSMLPLLGNESARQPAHLKMYANLLLQMERSDYSGEAELWVNRLIEQGVKDEQTAELLAEVRFRRKQFDRLLTDLSVSPNQDRQELSEEAKWFADAASFSSRFRILSTLTTRLVEAGENETAKRFDAAAQAMAKDLNQSSEFPGMFYAHELIKRGQCSAATAAFEKSASNATDDELVQFAESVFAAADCIASDLERIEAVYRELVSERKQQATLIVIVARLLETRGDYEQAIEIYQRIVKNDGNDLAAANNLASLLALTGKDPARGIEICNKLIDAHGPQMFLLDTRGVCKLKLGDPTAAFADFDQAYKMQPHPITLFHLAWAAKEQGNQAVADEMFQSAINKGLKKSDLHVLERSQFDSLTKRQ